MLTTTIPPAAPACTRYERLRIGRGNDDRTNALGDHLIDKRDLAAQIVLVLDAVDDQFIGIGVLTLVSLRPFAIVAKNSLASDFITRAIPRLT